MPPAPVPYDFTRECRNDNANRVQNIKQKRGLNNRLNSLQNEKEQVKVFSPVTEVLKV
jgi:hypothetical protein